MTKMFIAVLLMALVTYLPRVLPLAIFRKDIKSKYIKSFLYYLPFAVLAALTFPDIFYSTSLAASAIVGCVSALILAYFERSLLVVAIGSIVVVAMFELFIL